MRAPARAPNPRHTRSIRTARPNNQPPEIASPIHGAPRGREHYKITGARDRVLSGFGFGLGLGLGLGLVLGLGLGLARSARLFRFRFHAPSRPAPEARLPRTCTSRACTHTAPKAPASATNPDPATPRTPPATPHSTATESPENTHYPHQYSYAGPHQTDPV